MAMYDWNHDGKNDMQDNFIEYETYHDSTNDNKAPHSNHSSGGMSTFGSIVCVIMGLVIQSLLYTMLNIDVEDIPAIILLILWGVFSMLSIPIVRKLGL